MSITVRAQVWAKPMAKLVNHLNEGEQHSDGARDI